MVGTRRLLIVLAVLLAPLGAGCSRVHAKEAPESPPLEMPAPPPRDVEPNELPEAPDPIPLAQEPAHTAPSRARPPIQQPSRNEPPRQEPPKPEQQATPASEVPKPDEAPKPPSPTLQTTPSTAEGEVERGIKATLKRAGDDLNRIDYRALNSDGRMQYNQAKGYLRQADEAMNKKNLLFAKTLADKAAALATQLGGK